MTREIKFRAWNKNNDEMVYSFDYPYHWNIGDLGLELLESDGTDYVRQESVFMQFTGLYDKSNSPIYEGDFLSTDLSRPYLIVEFRNGAFMYQCHHNNQDYYDFMEPAYEELKFSTKYHEVIGNIHEHKHLLGGVDK